MRYLLDTNILTRLSNTSSADHMLVAQAVQTLTAQGHTLCLVPQVLYEFWAVASRPASANGLAMSTAQVRSELDTYVALFDYYPDQAEVFDHWLELVTRHSVIGKPTHDARLAAAALLHGIDVLLTRNTADFKRFGLHIVDPGELS